MNHTLLSLKGDTARRLACATLVAGLGCTTLWPLSRVFAAEDAVQAGFTPLEKKAAETIIPLLDFTEMTPTEALKAVAQQSGINVIYTAEAPERASLPFRLTKVSAARALYMVAQFSHLEIIYAADGVHCRALPVAAEGAGRLEIDHVFGVKQPWQTPFLAAYQLPAEAVIRHIPPPFIPERVDYLREDSHNPKTCADWLRLTQTGERVHTSGMGVTLGQAHTLREVLRHIVRLKPWEIEGTDALLALPLEGDWTVRDGLATDQLLRGLESVLSRETQRPLRFESRNVERLVVVARRTPEKREVSPRTIEIYAYNSSDTKLQAKSGDFPAFLAGVGDCLKMPVVSEIPGEPREFTWRLHRDAYASLMKERREELTARVLENLSTQMGLTFTTERKTVQAWQVVEGK